MAAVEPRPALTQDAGYQIGVRRTLPVPAEDAWQLITSAAGQAVWLGSGAALRFHKGESYTLANGAGGEVHVFNPPSHLRLSWQPTGWQRASLIQVRVIANGDRCIIAFHQEHLPGPEARSQRRSHYMNALKQLEQMLSA